MKAIIVERHQYNESGNLQELRSLAEAAGYSVIQSLEQVREPDSSYQIGRGKAEELEKLVKELDAEKVIFNNELKPIQEYNLAKTTGVEVIDRFRLILEIFAKRATTQEAKLQIQLASLRYELPRAREKVRLAKFGENPGFHGLGKYDIDVYYDMIRRQLTSLRSELKEIRGKRELQRKHRLERGFSLISLSGYTSSGKSTLFNTLAKESVPVGIGLFTTLSTVTRAVDFSGKKALLTDTVGFIDRLPLILIEAFRATLEETIFSNAILLVVDVSEPMAEVERKLYCCLNTIHEMGISSIPIITALNKIDLLSQEDLEKKFSRLSKLAPNPIPISALYETNIVDLRSEVAKHLENYVEATFVLPVNDSTLSLVSWIHDHANVLHEKYLDKQVRLLVEAFSWFVNKLKTRVEKLGGRLEDVKKV